ncbi:proteasome-type protease [Ectothiorhodospiraceae bacterium 2226]|nr:proteasome-type protease [Ectothiorhodospiraceae bacterium 2226]
MTYCVAVKLSQGLVFASDSRSHAGVDYVTTYGKMHVFEVPGERLFVLLSAGSLATTQAVVNLIERDMAHPDAAQSLRTVEYLFDAAHYVGALSQRVQREHAEALAKARIPGEASFLLGGQIAGQPHDLFLIYPQGNYIATSVETPFLQIGETKYGKPILDRIITPDTALEDAARCALVSLDSTMRSNISVGPPLELALYEKDALTLARRMTLKLTSPYYKSLQKRWNEGLRRAFEKLPRFDWEP